MRCQRKTWMRSRIAMVVTAAAVVSTPAMAVAQTNAAYASSIGGVTLELPGLPPPTAEIDLGRGLVRHSLGLCDAAIAGFIEGLSKDTSGSSAENAKFIAQQLTSARELGEVVSQVVHEVHVRVWDKLSDDGASVVEAVEALDKLLVKEGWESTVRVRDGGEMARVFLHRNDDSIGGVLVVARDGNDLVVVNLIGDLSEENVRMLSSSATSLLARLGMAKELDKAVEKLKSQQAR